MHKSRNRRLVAAAVLTLATTAGLITGPAFAEPGIASYRHASGIEILTGPIEGPPPPLAENVAATWSEAYDLATRQPNDFGYPAVDRTAKGGPTVLVRAATAAGERIARETTFARTAKIGAAGSVARLETTPASFAQLEAVKDESFDLKDTSIPGADSIWMTEPDALNNRVIISVERLTDELAAALVKRFGTTTYAVRIRQRLKIYSNTRDADTSPFYGGAKLFTAGSWCTGAFSWNINGVSGMVTAGHCIRYGGGVSASYDFGNVTSGSRENWENGGTVKINGSSYYRGDMALIEVRSAYSSAPYMWRSNTSYVPVREMWYRWSAGGDQYCAAGYASGELCGFSVHVTGINFDYYNDGVIRNAVQGQRWGNCVTAGDSGGPVYTIRSDGAVAAKGISSGGSFDGFCMHFYTDIWHAWNAFPGSVKIG